MPSPPIQVFLTTIVTQPSLKRRQEYILRILQSRKIPFASYDLASDEAAKTLWKRRAPIGKQELPGILVGGQYPGSFTEFEDAVEFGELDIYLRRNENWNEELANPATQLPTVPIGVPGAQLPSETGPIPKDSTPQAKEKFQSGQKVEPKDELSKYGLQDIKVSEEELADLVKELGIDGDGAKDLIKGLTPAETEPHPEDTKPEVKEESSKETTEKGLPSSA